MARASVVRERGLARQRRGRSQALPRRSRRSACSPYMPRPRLASVMPSCAVATYRSCRAGEVSTPSTRRASRSPATRPALERRLAARRSARTPPRRSTPLSTTKQQRSAGRPRASSCAPPLAARRGAGGRRAGQAEQFAEHVLDRDQPDARGPPASTTIAEWARRSRSWREHAIGRQSSGSCKHRAHQPLERHRAVGGVAIHQILHAQKCRRSRRARSR